MAGLYIHIPFCKQACHYCNFHFSTSLTYKNDFVAALLKEISLQREYLDENTVETIYFGGGTPSLLQKADLTVILEKLHQEFRIAANAEITLEANPDDMLSSSLSSWKQAGINRLSIGVQSFFEEDLRWMNRAHDASQAIQSVRLAKQAGFTNISIDLIYGSPTLPDEHWRSNVEQALAFDIPHFSCYALTVEPKTPLFKMIALAKSPDVNPDDQARQFLLLMQWMEAAGYEHYEISNFAKPGQRSRHNTAYWQGKKYLGLGPSAHSYNGQSRQWNIANNSGYIESLKKDELLFETETLTPVQVLNEYIMTSLRTMEGIDLDDVAEKFGTKTSNTILANAGKYIHGSYLDKKNTALVLTKEGKLLADGIAANLFFE
ncbi:MAG TPA: radical SAM family heme chaperone HemW [Puia sp.]|nr:radical SAM family heme chaperone HemW [Puia sp.]